MVFTVGPRFQFCRELRVLGKGGSQKVTNDDNTPKNADAIYEQPLTKNIFSLFTSRQDFESNRASSHRQLVKSWLYHDGENNLQG